MPTVDYAWSRTYNLSFPFKFHLFAQQIFIQDLETPASGQDTGTMWSLLLRSLCSGETDWHSSVTAAVIEVNVAYTLPSKLLNPPQPRFSHVQSRSESGPTQ